MFHALFPEETPQEWIDYYRTIWKAILDMRENDRIRGLSGALPLLHPGLRPIASSTPDASDLVTTDVWSDPTSGR